MSNEPIKPIWRVEPNIERLNTSHENSIANRIGIRFTEVGPDYLRATMPVDARTHQPLGLLHGGASVVLAETLGSVGGSYCVDFPDYFCVGVEVNANHVRAVRSGEVTGTASPLHIGRSTQVWEIRIDDIEQRLICISRITLTIRQRDKQ